MRVKAKALERVFSAGHQYHDRIFYDTVEGQYYDQATDLYLTLQEAAAFGIKAMSQSEQRGKNMRVNTKADPSMNPTDAPPTDLDEQMEGDEPLEPFGAQVLRRIHENHVILMEEYDEAIELLDHPEVKKHLTKLLQGIEATLTATEGLLGKHYPDLPGIEGAENKGLDEEVVEEEEEAPADEAAEAMLEKSLRGRAKQMFRQYKSWAKAMGVCPGCGKEDCNCTEEPQTKSAPKFSTKHLVKAIGKVLGKDLTDDEINKVEEKLETEASDTETTGEKGQKAGFELVYGRGGHGGPYSSLEEARNRAQQLLQGSRTEQTIYIVPRDERALDRRNAVEEVRKDEKGLRFVKAMSGVQVNDMVSVSGNQGIVVSVDKANQTADVKFNNGQTVTDVLFDDLTWEGKKSHKQPLTKSLTQRICKALGEDMTDDETTEMMGQVDEQMEQKSILCKSHKDAVMGAAGFLEEAGNHSGNWEDEHRMKAMSWHKALSEVGADPEPDMDEGSNMVDEGMPGEMGQKAGNWQEISASELDQEYRDGYTAGKAGKSQSSNPNGSPQVAPHEDNRAAAAWDKGWRDGSSGKPSQKAIPTQATKALASTFTQQSKQLEDLNKQLAKLSKVL